MPLSLRDNKHSRRRGIINTVNKLLKFQCLNNGFHFLEFKSKWLNNDNSLNMELFYGDDLELLTKWIIGKKKLLTFTIIQNTQWLIQNLHIESLLLFHYFMQIFHLFPLKAPQLILLTLYNPRSFLVTLIFQLLLKRLLSSLFWNSIIISFH